MMKGVEDMQSVGVPPSRGAGAATATTASSSLTEGEFTYDVHPFRFASATGLTPKLVTAKVSGGTSPRERLPLGMFSKNAALSSFGGKFGESKHWLTPRGEIGGHDLAKPRGSNPSYRHPSGSQTERGRDRRADRLKPERPQPQKGGTRGLQSVQGVTWRFLREGPRQQTLRERADASGGDARSEALQHSHPPEEAQFDAIMAGKGLGDGRRNIAEAYLSFERTLQKRMAKEEAREHGGGEDYASIRRELKEDKRLSEAWGAADDESSSSSDDEGGGQQAVGIEEEEEVDSEHEHAGLKKYVEDRNAAGAVTEKAVDHPPGGGRAAPRGPTKEDVAGSAGWGGVGSTFKGDRKGGLKGEEASVKKGVSRTASASTVATAEMDYDEDDVYLANPAMAPCIIWHTPMRVKIAANLPHDMRAEVAQDDTFVQDQRLVPDIWDHKFLPVTRRSVAAPLPKDSAKYKGRHYGAWYLPVDGWSKKESEKKKGLGLGGKRSKGGKPADEEEEEVPELLDKALREIAKLPSSKMFYQYIKSLKAPLNRVPHYLKKLEGEAP